MEMWIDTNVWVVGAAIGGVFALFTAGVMWWGLPAAPPRAQKLRQERLV